MPPAATLQQIMLAQVDPAADVIWGSVATIISREGTEDRRPRTPEEWTAVRRGAVALIDATDQLLIEGLRVSASRFASEGPGALDSDQIGQRIAANRPVFDRFTRELGDAGFNALAAIDAQDPAALAQAGGELEQRCEACHVTFWYPNQVIPALPADLVPPP
jgi:cytochrome c556